MRVLPLRKRRPLPPSCGLPERVFFRLAQMRLVVAASDTGGFLGEILFFWTRGLRARDRFRNIAPFNRDGLCSLVVLSLVLWPALVALLEISKAIWSVVPQTRN
jgi:hypothetical protein